MKILVMSGGNLKAVSFGAGVAKALEDFDIIPDVVIGCSGGALISKYLSCKTAHETYKLVSNIGKRSDWLSLNWKRLFLDGLFYSGPLADHLAAISERRKGGPTPYYVYCDLLTGCLHVEGTEMACLASMAEPPGVRPINGQYIDGGVRAQTPIKEALKKFDGKDCEFYVAVANPIVPNPKRMEKAPRTLLGILARSIDILIHNVFYDDFSEIRDSRVKAIFAPKKRIPIRAFSFKQSDIDKGLAAGVQSVKEWYHRA